MKRASKPDDDEPPRDDGIVQVDPIIVDHPQKSDPKLLNTVLKVIDSKSNLFDSKYLFLRLLEQNPN